MSLSLHALPIDILYRILDHLSDKDFFLPTSNVSQRLNAILNSYQSFQVNLTLYMQILTCALHQSNA